MLFWELVSKVTINKKDESDSFKQCNSAEQFTLSLISKLKKVRESK